MSHTSADTSIIKRQQDLNDLCAQIDETRRFGLDLEFIPERSYEPELCLVQVATEKDAYIVDPFAIRDLGELWRRVADPDVLVILHAGDQDLDLIYQHSGLLPQNISDTQIAAAFIGFGYPVGYGKLVHQVLGVSISKAESYTDWTNRPLSAGQVAYALDDVRHLLGLHDAIHGKLKASGRIAWVEDECKRYSDASYYEKDRSRDFLRIKGATSLPRRSLAVLKTLSDWRHGEAARQNKPLRMVLPDNILLEFARHPPKNLNDVKRIRGVRPDQLKNYGQGLLDAVEDGLHMPDSELPTWPSGRIPTRREILTSDLLFSFLKVLIYDLDLAPELVATRGQLELLVRMHGEGHLDHERVPLLRGWRYELVGKHLVHVLDGAHCNLRVSAAGDHPISLQVNPKDRTD